MLYFKAKNILSTKAFASKVAVFLKEQKNKKKAVILSLSGDLGSGKTTFSQFLAKALGIKNSVVSPTFILMRKYKIPKGIGSFASLIHIDAYRFKSEDELLKLGWKEIVSNSRNLVIVEWAEKIRKILPKGALWIFFKHVDESRRGISSEHFLK